MVKIGLRPHLYYLGECGSFSIKKKLVFILEKASLNFARPKRFNHGRNIYSITDASELFIETPKDPTLQRLTWSKYKHNTAKVLTV